MSFLTQTASKPTKYSFWDGDSSAPRTPWGPAQTLVDLANGVKSVSTAGHGGIRLNKEKQKQKQIPKCFRKTWYEEDCEAAIVVYFLYDELKALADKQLRENGAVVNSAVLPYMRSSTKENAFMHFYSWFGGAWDARRGVTKAKLDSFKDYSDSQYVYERYCNDYDAELERIGREKVAQRQKGSLQDGVRVEFASPFQFTFGGENLTVKTFIVRKYGRKVRFEVNEKGNNFLAHLTGWRNTSYSIVGTA